MNGDRTTKCRDENTTSFNELRWRARFELAAQNERDTIQVGVQALQTAVLINAGALVALLAFVGQVWEKGQGHLLVSRVLNATTPYMWGLIFAALAFVFAYFNRWAATRRAQQRLADPLIADTSSLVLRSVKHVQIVSRIAMIILTLGAFGAFIWATLSVANAFTG